MGNPYTSQTISGYNASPPPDDATAVAANQVFWSKHKDKLGDPLKVLAEGINTQALASFGTVYLGHATNAVTTNYTVVEADERKVIEATNSITVTLLAVATAGVGFTLAVKNPGTGTVVVDADGSEVIDDALTIQLFPKDGLILQCNGTNWNILARSGDPAATGTYKDQIKTTADAGWVVANGSLGSATSGATTRANADAEPLYTLFYDNMADAQAPVATGRGASAAADFAANKALTMPDERGRTSIGTGTGGGLTARVNGVAVGVETHQLTEAEMPAHTHAYSARFADNAGTGNAVHGGPTEDFQSVTLSAGSDTAHPNMQPSIAHTRVVKL